MALNGRALVGESPSRRYGVRLAWLAMSVLLLIPLPADAQSPPMTYSAISNRNTYPYPPLPALGGAGYQFIDPTFGSKMLRVTDANTRPDRVGRFWASPSSAETSAWNTNSTKFYVVGGGGEQLPYNFNPSTMTATRMGNLGNGSGGLVLQFGGEPSFSFVDPDLIYGDNSQSVYPPTSIVSYRFSTATATTINNVQNCIPGVATHGLNMSVTKDDRRFVTYIGGSSQDSDTYVYVYDQALGCRWLNTQTGQVGGQWGPTGAYTGDVGYYIHNARISKDGKWARITSAGNALAGMYFWNLETLTVTACPTLSSPYCGGHLVTGFTRFVNQRQLGDGMDFAIRPMASINNVAALINPLLTPSQYANDTHPSWNNVQSDEKEPVCLEAYRSDDLVQRAWDGEILCIETDGVASTVWRFAQHRSHYVSFWDTPRANVSQDGRLVLFTSNWEATLGLQPDGTLRQDAFIVQLAPPNTRVPMAPSNFTVR